MSELAIVGEGLSKLYARSLAESTGLRHSLDKFLRSPTSVLRREKKEAFWALKDVSLKVCKGEVLGLIGRNGAGKTTLLKILSRITLPTTGWAEIRGRVGSLLEVGTGFHPELTGRENTFLSGAILGMSKLEIASKFDEIVAFAELEKFIDTPVKHYSSGMYVRLAFAVAAHLEPEILLVDEVLAVGDINFQRKCLGKMGDASRAGRTIVLVSHQMNQIRRLCDRVIWIDDGHLRMDGRAHDVLAAYESTVLAREGSSSITSGGGSSAKVKFQRWEISEPSARGGHTLETLGPVTVTFYLEIAVALRRCEHGVALYNTNRQLIWASAATNLDLKPGHHAFSHSLSGLPLRPGSYQWQVSVSDETGMLDIWDCIPEMNIATNVFQHHRDEWNGILNLPVQFSIRSS
jgi:lipopolysaccharide transport system ATP-binding protein